MSQDIVSDVLNQIMNAKRAGKLNLVSPRFSKLLIEVLKIMKEKGYIDFSLKDDELKIELKNLNECKAVKPRYNVNKKTIDKYVRRYLPARNFGYVLVSTSKGLMIHSDAQDKKIGGSLIAYFY